MWRGRTCWKGVGRGEGREVVAALLTMSTEPCGSSLHDVQRMSAASAVLTTRTAANPCIRAIPLALEHLASLRGINYGSAHLHSDTPRHRHRTGPERTRRNDDI